MKVEIEDIDFDSLHEGIYAIDTHNEDEHER